MDKRDCPQHWSLYSSYLCSRSLILSAKKNSWGEDCAKCTPLTPEITDCIPSHEEKVCTIFKTLTKNFTHSNFVCFNQIVTLRWVTKTHFVIKVSGLLDVSRLCTPITPDYITHKGFMVRLNDPKKLIN